MKRLKSKFPKRFRSRLEQLEPRAMLAAGDLDTTFGNGGIAITDWGSDSDIIKTMALQSDGKMVVADPSGGHGFTVARYNTDGSLDTSFGSGGRAATDVGNGG